MANYNPAAAAAFRKLTKYIVVVGTRQKRLATDETFARRECNGHRTGVVGNHDGKRRRVAASAPFWCITMANAKVTYMNRKIPAFSRAVPESIPWARVNWR